MSAQPRRVGMFGGSFDPPHRAHVALAEAAVHQLGLDLLYVFPTGDAWHKARALSPAVHRLAMVRLAFAGVAGAQVDDRELRRSGPTYSVETLRELRDQHPGADLYLLMGEDQAAGFVRWQAWGEIATLATLCVAGRGDGDASGIAQLRALPHVRVQSLEMPRMPDSATHIRALLTARQDIAHLVDASVASYIAQHNLYQSA